MKHTKLNWTFGTVAIAALLVLACEARANIIYSVNLAMGAGGVVGTITTNGNVGVIGAPDIVAWNLDVTGNSGATLNLTNAGGLSGVAVGNNTDIFNPNAGTPDLTADANNIYFNFSATDGGYLGFQVLPFFTGQKYFSVGALNNQDAPSGGLSATPVLFSDPTTIFLAQTGNQIIASVPRVSVPDLTNSLQLLAFGLFGLAAFHRRYRE